MVLSLQDPSQPRLTERTADAAVLSHLNTRGVTTVAELRTGVTEELQNSSLKVTQFLFKDIKHVNLQCQTIHSDCMEESKVDASQSLEVSHEDTIPALELVWQISVQP